MEDCADLEAPKEEIEDVGRCAVCRKRRRDSILGVDPTVMYIDEACRDGG